MPTYYGPPRGTLIQRCVEAPPEARLIPSGEFHLCVAHGLAGLLTSRPGAEPATRHGGLRWDVEPPTSRRLLEVRAVMAAVGRSPSPSATCPTHYRTCTDRACEAAGVAGAFLTLPIKPPDMLMTEGELREEVAPHPGGWLRSSFRMIHHPAAARNNTTSITPRPIAQFYNPPHASRRHRRMGMALRLCPWRSATSTAAVNAIASPDVRTA